MRQGLVAVTIVVFYLGILGSRSHIVAHLGTAICLSPRVFESGPERSVLPLPVQAALSLLDRTEGAEYRLSSGFMKDGLLIQRLVESAWPKRQRDTARLWIGLPSESLPEGCTASDTEKEARLAHCL